MKDLILNLVCVACCCFLVLKSIRNVSSDIYCQWLLLFIFKIHNNPYTTALPPSLQRFITTKTVVFDFIFALYIRGLCK